MKRFLFITFFLFVAIFLISCSLQQEVVDNTTVEGTEERIYQLFVKLLNKDQNQVRERIPIRRYGNTGTRFSSVFTQKLKEIMNGNEEEEEEKELEDLFLSDFVMCHKSQSNKKRFGGYP
ncbi:hypothetical protein ABK040_005093 [Willaertia magna]